MGAGPHILEFMLNNVSSDFELFKENGKWWLWLVWQLARTDGALFHSTIPISCLELRNLRVFAWGCSSLLMPNVFRGLSGMMCWVVRFLLCPSHSNLLVYSPLLESFDSFLSLILDHKIIGSKFECAWIFFGKLTYRKQNFLDSRNKKNILQF